MNRGSKIALGVAAVLLVAAAVKWEMRPLVPRGPADATPPDGCNGIAAAAPPTVWLGDLTSHEICAALAAGYTTVIIPTAGTEQNGPHVVLFKHHYVVQFTSEKIARELGDALIAPIVDYVPEGRIDPPAQHMRYAGTISIPAPVFAALIEATARSLRQHGFRFIAFVGESGPNQDPQRDVAARLNREWGAKSALHVTDYYGKNGQLEYLLAQGETKEAIGTHAAIRDTSEVLAAHPDAVRRDRIAAENPASSGVIGDPSRASAERGEVMLKGKIDAAVAQIRAAR